MREIPFAQIRGGSSKGIYLHKNDLPKDVTERNETILSIMEGVGHGDPRQVDGLGGGDSLTAKVAIVSRSEQKGVDLEYLFVQVMIGKGQVATVQNCGNILSGVLPYAIETGMLPAEDGHTSAIIRMVNSDSLCEVIIETPGKKVNYQGLAKVDGVYGTAAPIICNYLNVAGKNCGALLPTGNIIDQVDGIELTCIDNGMPVVVLRASDMGITGYETKAELDKNENLKSRLEGIRLQVGPRMNLGDVTDKTVPKMCLISPSKSQNLINTRTFIPHVCHAAIGVLGAVSSASACLLPGSVGERIIGPDIDTAKPIVLDHPSGSFAVNLTVEVKDGRFIFPKSGVIRTARLISMGKTYIPSRYYH